MKKLSVSEIWPPAIYEGVRQDFRAKVIAHKKNRRVEVGPYMTFVFEDRLTVKFQIQEVLRAEKVSDPEHIAEEVEGFNTMLPEDGALSATLLIASKTEEEAVARLGSLVGLRERVFLEIGGERYYARFDPNRENSVKISAVQYLLFRLPPGAAEALGRGPARLVVDHPSYQEATVLADSVRASLQQDLRAEV